MEDIVLLRSSECKTHRHIAVVCSMVVLYFKVCEALIQNLECLQTTSGAEYRGRLNVSVHENPCLSWYLVSLRWDTVPLHGDLFPEADIRRAYNLCRNPGGIRGRPWCYVGDGDVWEYCDIPLCGCKVTVAGTEYRGGLDVTVSGVKCQDWSAQHPHQHQYTPQHAQASTLERNYCRNPLPGDPGGPWCYTANPSTRWEYCAVPYCECVTSASGLASYGGHIAQTETGHSCIRWDTFTINSYMIHDIARSIETINHLYESSNYCRNPTPDTHTRPWCYVGVSQRWEYCDIPHCDVLTQDTAKIIPTNSTVHSLASSPATTTIDPLHQFYHNLTENPQHMEYNREIFHNPMFISIIVVCLLIIILSAGFAFIIIVKVGSSRFSGQDKRRNKLDKIHKAVLASLQDEVITTPDVILKNKFVQYGRVGLDNFRNTHFEGCCDDDRGGDVCLNSGRKIMESFL